MTTSIDMRTSSFQSSFLSIALRASVPPNSASAVAFSQYNGFSPAIPDDFAGAESMSHGRWDQFVVHMGVEHV
jgi:hypothetical protein